MASGMGFGFLSDPPYALMKNRDQKKSNLEVKPVYSPVVECRFHQKSAL
jgi:hypothetical protein